MTAAAPTSFRLDDQVAVVIGGTGVLCGRMAAALADAGATTVIVGRDEAKGAAAAEALAVEGPNRVIEFHACDVAERLDIAALAQHAISAHGRVDVLVNGAGVNAATPFLEIADDEMERIVAINQLAVVRACQEFGRYFVERAERDGTGASIINVGSASGLRPLSRVFTYSMTKAAVHNLTKNLAR